MQAKMHHLTEEVADVAFMWTARPIDDCVQACVRNHGLDQSVAVDAGCVKSKRKDLIGMSSAYMSNTSANECCEHECCESNAKSDTPPPPAALYERMRGSQRRVVAPPPDIPPPPALTPLAAKVQTPLAEVLDCLESECTNKVKPPLPVPGGGVYS